MNDTRETSGPDAGGVGDGPGETEQHGQAAAVTATMVGALTLARALSDPAEARAILAAARQSILADHGGARERPTGA